MKYGEAWSLRQEFAVNQVRKLFCAIGALNRSPQFVLPADEERSAFLQFLVPTLVSFLGLLSVLSSGI